jgi:hypothetical protein
MMHYSVYLNFALYRSETVGLQDPARYIIFEVFLCSMSAPVVKLVLQVALVAHVICGDADIFGMK